VASVRARVTVAYGIATLATIAVFAVILIAERRASTLTRLVEEGRNTASLAGSIIERSSLRGISVDTLTGPRPIFPLSVTSLLDALPGYLVVGDSSQVLFRGRALRRFDELANAPGSFAEARTNAISDRDKIEGAGFDIRSASEIRRVRLSTHEVIVLSALHEPPLAGGVRRVVVGVSTQRVSDVTSELAALTFLVAPVLALLASGIAWTLAGRAFQPVNQMVNDVEAITDGRSLHRRVVLDAEETDEFGRLGRTVNDMIGRLETSFGALRRFTADASHELRTPLTVIRADVERAMNTSVNSHEHAVALEEALQQVSRMTGLVESLLTLARADEGRFEVVREAVPLEPLIREVAETAVILGEEKEISVTIPIMQPATVLGDVERLRQLFLNLATNAVKYTERGGRVEISLEARHEEAIVTVKDDGIGIAAADLPFIFERFWRVDRARTRSEGSGSGLGLAISQWIAHAHEGRIDVVSRLGRGSTFTIVLPAAPRGNSTPNSALTNS
jgi:two-component system OmpR family sensor kinase